MADIVRALLTALISILSKIEKIPSILWSGMIFARTNMASRLQNCSKRPKWALLTHRDTFVCRQ